MLVYEEVGNRHVPPPTVAERQMFLDKGKDQSEMQGKTDLRIFGPQRCALNFNCTAEYLPFE